MIDERQTKFQKTRSFYISLSFLLALFITVTGLLIWGWFGRMDEAVPGVGQIMPDGRLNKVTSPYNGIVYRVYVKPDQEVKKGQVLVELDPEMTLIEQRGVSQQLNLLMQESNALRMAYANKRPLSDGSVSSAWLRAAQNEYQNDIEAAKMNMTRLKHEYGQVKEDLLKNQNLLQKSEEQLNSYNNLYEQGGLSEKDLRNYEQRVIDLRGTVASSSEELKAKEMEMLQSQRATGKISGSYQRDILERLSGHQRDIAQISAQVQQSRLNSKRQRIVAPANGYVNDLIIRTPGETVAMGDTIMTIVPENAGLVAEIKVGNKDLSYIKTDQKVILRMDALPYQKFGKMTGKVKSISPSTQLDENNRPFYMVRVKPDKVFLTDRVGNIHYIKSGMTVMADFITRDKNILSFITEPISENFEKAFKEPSTRQ